MFFKEKQTFGFWSGLAVALAGAALIVGLDSLKSANFGLGSFYGRLAGFFYGGFFLFSQRSLEKLTSLAFFWIASLSSSVVLLGFAIVLDQPLTGYSPQSVLLFLGLGLVVQVLGWFVISYAQRNLPASIVAPSLLGQPVLTAFLANSILHEEITRLEILGGTAVLLGIYMIHRSRLNRLPTDSEL